jgi:hypothetical protein
VTQLDPATLEEVRPLSVAESPADVAFGHGALFIALHSEDETYVKRVDVQANYKVDWTVSVPHSAVGIPFLKMTADAVWVRSAYFPGAVTALNPKTGQTMAQFSVDGYALAITSDAVFDTWISDSTAITYGTIRRLDRNTGKELSRYPLDAHDVVTQGRSLVAALYSEDAVVRVDPQTGALSPRIAVGDGPSKLLVTQQALWVLNFREETLSRLPLA